MTLNTYERKPACPQCGSRNTHPHHTYPAYQERHCETCGETFALMPLNKSPNLGSIS